MRFSIVSRLIGNILPCPLQPCNMTFDIPASCVSVMLDNIRRSTPPLLHQSRVSVISNGRRRFLLLFLFLFLFLFGFCFLEMKLRSDPPDPPIDSGEPYRISVRNDYKKTLMFSRCVNRWQHGTPFQLISTQFHFEWIGCTESLFNIESFFFFNLTPPLIDWYFQGKIVESIKYLSAKWTSSNSRRWDMFELIAKHVRAASHLADGQQHRLPPATARWQQRPPLPTLRGYFEVAVADERHQSWSRQQILSVLLTVLKR